MLKTPLTKERIKHHFTYGWWKYLIACGAVLFGVNLLFTMTAYRAPDELRVDVYVSASGANQEALQAYLDVAHAQALPDMEEVTAVTMMSNDGSDPYTTMQLSTYIMAGEGDIYLLSQNDFKAYAGQGGMVSLDDYIASGALHTEGVALEKGIVAYQAEENGPEEKHVYGIPAEEMFGFWDFSIDNRGMVLCVMAASGNEANSVKLLDYMINTLTKPMPTGE